MRLYRYTSLHDEKLAFRLLKLQKGYFEEPIRCQLWHSRLPRNDFERKFERPDYVALSYTWGGQRKIAEIDVNGCTFHITKNLLSALRHIRSETTDQDLWVDAVCINQLDPRERSHQVGHMKNIYQEALGVYVWLGECTIKTDLAMAAMTKLQKDKETINGDWRSVIKHTVFREPYLRGHDGPVQEGLNDLLCRPWFTRIWILQEIASARVAKIFCGKRSISAQIFALFPSLLGITPDTQCQAVLDIMPGPSRHETWWAQKRDLRTLLSKFGRCRATQSCDMIYALLGISEDACDGESLKVDYRRETPLYQILQQTIWFLLSYLGAESSLFPLLFWQFDMFQEKLSHLEGFVLEAAIEQNKDVMVQLILEKAAVNLDIHPDLRWKLQHWATKRDRGPVLGLLQSLYGIEKASCIDTFDLLVQALKDRREEEVLRHVNYNRIHAMLKDEAGRTLLSHAAEHGSHKMVKELCELHTTYQHRQTQPDSDNEKDVSSSASNIGQEAGVRGSIKHTNTSHDFKDKSGRSPLSYAAERGQEGISWRLFQKLNLDPDLRDNIGRTPLSYAAETGNIKEAKLFIEQFEVHVDSMDNIGRTPVSYAVARGHAGLVQLLLDNGADIHSRDAANQTPLLIGLKEENERVLKVLAIRTLIPYPMDSIYAQIVRVFLRQDIYLELRDDVGRTLLMYASKHGRTALAELVIPWLSGVDNRDESSRSPLSYAAENGHDDMVELLINRGATINFRDLYSEQTPLSHAIKHNRTGTVKLLNFHRGIQSRESNASCSSLL